MSFSDLIQNTINKHTGGGDNNSSSSPSYGNEGPYSAGGSSHYNTPNAANPNPHYGGSGGYGSDDDFNPAVSHAQAEHGEDSSLFNTALSFIKDRKSQYAQKDNYDIDESHMVQSHQALYGGGGDERAHDSNSLGAGAAMQALKMFTSGGGSSSESSGGGMDKNKLIGIAMAQAGKLWEEKNSNGGASEDKQSAVNKAAEMALKMYMKGQGSGSSGTGGPGGLMSLASKFLK
ncbi:hypothetical protein P170DRAFT_463916 [Aspergillus steynii IBT 23096]|uniref:DUF7721 domain-containing protein n=1 Tax=Aspergillus steynii IBT 23096 TaxID=1392250 RepID=A0A2I2GDA4_9EURO|nr:uncharacterized protein P170DRAFT_463916 [Aspergillus steynii IBT 23096]PLB50831.1 hypothetical protein P170DRAFT_463916 [Aspergillus steynii IBT 23096]